MICRSRDFRPVPVSRKLRSKWCEDSMGLASNLALYSSTPLDAALRMPASVIKDFFESKAFEDWKKNREAEGRMATGNYQLPEKQQGTVRKKHHAIGSNSRSREELETELEHCLEAARRMDDPFAKSPHRPAHGDRGSGQSRHHASLP